MFNGLDMEDNLVTFVAMTEIPMERDYSIVHHDNIHLGNFNPDIEAIYCRAHLPHENMTL